MAAMMNHCLAAMGMSEMRDVAETFPGTGLTQRVEGRIAFLRAELKIDDSQAAAWADFAQALRNNAKTLVETHVNVSKRRASANAPLTLSESLAAQEEWFASRAAGIGGLRKGLQSLYAVLSDTQKHAADELLPAHLGVGDRGSPMGMMSMGGMPMPGAATGTH